MQTQPFWVGIGAPLENRVISRGYLYLAGSIVIAPIGASLMQGKAVIPSLNNAGKALISWDPDTSRTGDFEMMTQLDVIPELNLFDKMSAAYGVALGQRQHGQRQKYDIVLLFLCEAQTTLAYTLVAGISMRHPSPQTICLQDYRLPCPGHHTHVHGPDW